VVGAEEGDADGANVTICVLAFSAAPLNGMDIPEYGRDMPGNDGRDMPGNGSDMPGDGSDMPGKGRDMPGYAKDMHGSFPKEASCR
jgi:hypothetical protein